MLLLHLVCISTCIAPYNATHPVVLMFWKVLRQYFNNTPWINADGPSNSNSCEPQTPNPSRDVNEARLRKLILFWTGSSSLPSRGYYANSHDHATANSEEQEPVSVVKCFMNQHCIYFLFCFVLDGYWRDGPCRSQEGSWY